MIKICKICPIEQPGCSCPLQNEEVPANFTELARGMAPVPV